MQKVHSIPYAMHPVRNKLYRDLRELCWWPGMKHEVTDYVSKCLTCQQVKAKHQLPSGLLQPIYISILQEVTRGFGYKIELQYCVPPPDRRLVRRVIQILEDMLRCCVIDFRGSWEDYLSLAESAYNNKLGERRVLGPELVSDTELVSDAEEKLELPPDLDKIHDVFHVSMLRRYHSDPTHIVPVEEIKVRTDLTFEEEPVQILDRDVKVLRRKSIPLVKVFWRNHSL
ncbi:uncharacterized protein LOC108464972 [Gossypium arboreum]|uniref:uncharacterized protein LOC108464972 n=1 Tax=Gossypium arboreum TaxID=29729 RepID=UPI000819595D|nr:uncharacterized protein LOC108464972 [Gossypium arboreum]